MSLGEFSFGHLEGLCTIRHTPDGRNILSGGADGDIR
jgi:hypothetical protein